MTDKMDSIWRELHQYRETHSQPILSMFKDDPDRATQFSAHALGMLFDFSKTTIDRDIMATLLRLVETSGVRQRTEDMFAGAHINETEDRAVLHTALRARDRRIVDAGADDQTDVLPEIEATRARMAAFCDDVRAGRLEGAGGAISDVINIGIGGSDLGPAMAARALRPYHDGPRVHFVSNVDGADLFDTLAVCDPKTTLVIVASKTFTTIETMTNARTARDWMTKGGGDPAKQFVAVSTAIDRTEAFGIPAKHVFGFADWVGGRYSVWGPIGLSLMVAIGPHNFDAFLAGGREMDHHFRTAPSEANLPMLLALVGIWHHQICGYATRAVLPYENRLARLPAYLQQLEMESNGKSVAMDGTDLTQTAGPIVWGEPGTNGQHAFYQLIHQGRQVVPCEFILTARGHEKGLEHHHKLLLANGLAQSRALMIGRSFDTALAKVEAAGFTGPEAKMQAAHRVFPGNRPSTTLLIDLLTPKALGQLIALYEHRVFVEGVILGINSFDQWGVELGKELAVKLSPLLEGADADQSAADVDPSTAALAAQIRAFGG